MQPMDRDTMRTEIDRRLKHPMCKDRIDDVIDGVLEYVSRNVQTDKFEGADQSIAFQIRKMMIGAGTYRGTKPKPGR